jgi:hypothetical protein
MYVSMYVCMYVCKYLCMCVCMCVFVCVCMCICMYVCKWIMYVCGRACDEFACVYLQMFAKMPMCIQARMYNFMHAINTFVRTCVHVYRGFHVPCSTIFV